MSTPTPDAAKALMITSTGLGLGLVQLPDGSTGALLIVGNSIAEVRHPMNVEQTDQLIAALTELRGQMHGGLSIASPADVGKLNGRGT